MEAQASWDYVLNEYFYSYFLGKISIVFVYLIMKGLLVLLAITGGFTAHDPQSVE